MKCQFFFKKTLMLYEIYYFFKKRHLYTPLITDKKIDFGI